MVAFLGHELRNFLSRSGDYPGVKASWVRATALGLAVAVGTVPLAGTPAYAHNSLSSSAPKDKAVLDRAPAVVSLKFLAKLSPQGTKVSLVDPAGTSAAGGPHRFDGPTVIIPLRATVAGPYTASYEVASSDGHPIRGKITFTLTALAVPSPTPGAPTPVPSAAAPSPAAAPIPSLRSTASDVAGGVPWLLWGLAAVLVTAALAGGVAFLLVRRRRTG